MFEKEAEGTRTAQEAAAVVPTHAQRKKPANDYVKEADAAFMAGDYTEAVKSCLQCVAAEKGGSGKISETGKWIHKKLVEYLEATSRVGINVGGEQNKKEDEQSQKQEDSKENPKDGQSGGHPA
jgi:hypothetical protein